MTDYPDVVHIIISSRDAHNEYVRAEKLIVSVRAEKLIMFMRAEKLILLIRAERLHNMSSREAL